MSIRKRLRWVVAVALAAALLIGATALAALSVVAEELRALVDEELPLTDRHDDLLQGLTEAETAERGFLITGQEVSLEGFESGLRRFRFAASQVRDTAQGASVRDLLAEEIAAGERWIESFAIPVVAQRREDPDAALARAVSGEGRELFDEFRTAHLATSEALEARVTERKRTAERTTLVARIALGAILVLGAGIAAAVGMRTLRDIVRPLDRLVATLERLRGDRAVRARIEGPPEIQAVGTAVNELAEENERFAEQRQQVVERLEELDQQKSDFVSTVSHELRTPLTSIIGYLEMLGDGDAGPLNEDQLELLHVADRNSQRLLALIEDMLTLSRIESGKLRSADEPVDVADLARGVVEELRPRTVGRDLQLHLDLDDDLGAVRGDAAQLERVLFNLLGNALKFSPDGGTVRVAGARADGEVQLVVSDQGIGIPVDEQARLFQRFYRASTATDRAIPGTGLGLAITKLLVEQHGGDIRVHSEPGQGTSFTVALPALSPEGSRP